jgi:hypothetical protein
MLGEKGGGENPGRPKKNQYYCVTVEAPKIAPKCLRGNSHQCPMFVEMDEDGGEWPVDDCRVAEGPSYYANTLAQRRIFPSRVTFWTPQICTTREFRVVTAGTN